MSAYACPRCGETVDRPDRDDPFLCRCRACGASAELQRIAVYRRNAEESART